MSDLVKKLQAIRRFTGDRFSPAKGYDARKPMSRAREVSINRYFEMVLELTGRPHKVFNPPKGYKREVFEYSGQRHHPKFTKAIIHIPDPDAKYSFSIDRTRPKGSRFILTNKRTRERSWHVPASAFLDENEFLYREDEDVTPEFIRDVLEEYAHEGQTYLIEAGDSYMWGSAGPIMSPVYPGEGVAYKLADLFKQYGAGHFDAADKNSHFIGNWFRGVQVYADYDDVIPYIRDRIANQTKYLTDIYKHRAHEMQFTKFREMKDGRIGIFYKGQYVPGSAKRPVAEAYEPKKPRNRKNTRRSK